MRYLILSVIIFSALLSPALAQDTTEIWYDSNWEITESESKMAYYRQKFKIEPDLWGVYDHFPTGEIQMIGSFKDEDFENKHGYFVYFQENGDTTIMMNYVDGSLEGPYRRFYDNGLLEIQTVMVDDKQHGPTFYFHESGGRASEGNYVGGMKNGKWLYYDENGESIGDEYFSQKVKLPCNWVIHFDNGRWIHTNYKNHGERLKNFTIDNFFRKGVYDGNGNELIARVDAGCVVDTKNVENADLNLFAKIMLKNMGIKGKKVNTFAGRNVDLHGGVLYTYKMKEAGKKVTGYLYVLTSKQDALELFFIYEKQVSGDVMDEMVNIIENIEVN